MMNTIKCSCNGNKGCKHYNLAICFPELCEEWDYEKNEKSPDQYLPRSGIKVHWKCKINPCGCHEWCVSIISRTQSSTGCPYCSHRKLCCHDNLLIKSPKLCEEWDYENNKLTPDNYSPNSDKVVYWICKINPCGCHVWKTSIANRLQGRGCPYCVNKRLCKHNNLTMTHPELCEQWNYELNKLGPESYSFGSDMPVWWECKKNHKWNATIGNRTRQNSDCPICCKNMYSKKQISWINSIAEYHKINIQTIVSHGKEHIVKCSNNINYKLDGYADYNGIKIAFEFDGCFWHGCIDCCDLDDVNSVNKKSFRQLHEETMLKKRLIREQGYEVVTMRECDFDSNNIKECDILLGKGILLFEGIDF